jgi:Flp pilus assembly protein TadD
LLASAALLVAACTSDDGQLNIRAIADPLAAAAKRGSPMIVEGRGALALGNVGTALEAFRKALREQPDSIEALAGIAACYERMGRYDLSRANYEAALAIAPNNPILLNSFAASLQTQGRLAEATALRAEAAEAEAAEVALAVRLAQADIAPAVANVAPASPRPEAIRAEPPRAKSAPAAVAPVRTVRTAAAPIRPAPRQEEVVHREVVDNTEWTIAIPRAGADIPQVELAANVVTVSLPPASPVKAEAATPRDEPPVQAVAVAEQVRPSAPRASEDRLVAAAPQPRLQRISMGEVALLTGAGPAWKTEVVAQTRSSVTARFVPLQGTRTAERRTATARFVPLKTMMATNRINIRLLNAARRQGLAARTRLALVDRGWRRIAIGDAPQVRARSIVLYPANRQQLGKRLAAQFGFASAINRRSDEVLVLLGRDAPSLSFRRAA